MTSQEYELLPQEVKNIVDFWDEDMDLYVQANKIKTALEYIGWTCDYGLDGEVHTVRPINCVTGL